MSLPSINPAKLFQQTVVSMTTTVVGANPIGAAVMGGLAGANSLGQLQQLQKGLESLGGFGGRRLWFSALVEVSSWSITMAIVYKTIDSALVSYLQDAQTLAFSDTRFLDVISLLAFMSSLPFVVPVVTGRLIGSSALGALANVSMGGTLTDGAFGSGRHPNFSYF